MKIVLFFIMTSNLILKAIQITGGTQKSLAEAINRSIVVHKFSMNRVKQQNVSLWLKNGVSKKVAVAIELATNNKINRHMLRPDIFGLSSASTQEDKLDSKKEKVA